MISVMPPRRATPPDSDPREDETRPHSQLRQMYEYLDPSAVLATGVVPVLIVFGVILLYWSERRVDDWRLQGGVLSLLTAAALLRPMRVLVLAARRRSRTR